MDLRQQQHQHDSDKQHAQQQATEWQTQLEEEAEEEEEQQDEDLMDSDDEDYNQKNFGIYQALPVDEAEPDWSQEMPDTAEEYLRRVRYEAARCPRVVRVDPASPALLQPSAAAVSLPEPEGISDAPDWAKPNQQWVEKFVQDFQQLRSQVRQCYDDGEYAVVEVPHVNDVDAWQNICFGRQAQARAASCQQNNGAEVTNLTAEVCVKLMALTPADVVHLFLRHASELEERCLDSLPLLRAQWLFALASRLEKPCHAEVAAAFRALLRHCCKLRAAVAQAADPVLPQLNVLIVIAGAYFAQDEELCSLVDSLELL